jgi:hypothetical protein
MSDERLARIESKVDELAASHAELRQGHTELRADVTDLRADGTGLRADVTELKQGQVAIITRLTKAEIIQEDMRDQIRAIAEGHASLLTAMDRGFAMVAEELDRRLTPVELAIRERR